jgi:hypothetical protein
MRYLIIDTEAQPQDKKGASKQTPLSEEESMRIFKDIFDEGCSAYADSVHLGKSEAKSWEQFKAQL